MKNIKMLKQILSQLEHYRCVLSLKLTTLWRFRISRCSLFHRSGQERAKAWSPKVLKLVLRILRRPWLQERRRCKASLWMRSIGTSSREKQDMSCFNQEISCASRDESWKKQEASHERASREVVTYFWAVLYGDDDF